LSRKIRGRTDAGIARTEERLRAESAVKAESHDHSDIVPYNNFCDNSKTRERRGNTMSRKIFVNLPVKDLKKSIEFFGKLGFTFHKQFTG